MSKIKKANLRNRVSNAWRVLRGKSCNTVECEKSIKVLYICNRKACGKKCIYPECMHTTDVRFAENFSKGPFGNDYMEVLKDD